MQRFLDGQPVRRWGFADHRAIAAPGPVAGCLHHAGLHRVEYHIARQFQQVRLLLYQHSLVAALQHVPNATVASVEPLGVDTVDLAHALRQGRATRFDQQVIMIGHLTPGPNAPVEAMAYAGKITDKGVTILLVKKNFCPGIAARHHVVERSFEFNTQRTSHAEIVVQNLP